MANMRSQIKIKQIEMIENNINLIEILFYIFKGQVLDMDLKEFCISNKIYETERQYNNVVKNLITNNILKVKKLVKTNNNVLIAKAPVHNFFGCEGKTTRYSIETVTRNSYLNYILLNGLQLDMQKDMQKILNILENRTTLLSTKRDVESCYKMFNNKLTKNGIEAKKEALYREEKRKSKLKNIEKVELIENMELIYPATLQTLRERDIYFTNRQIIITDNNSDYILSNLSTKIAIAIKVLVEQVEITDFSSIQILVLVKDEASKKRLENNFIMKYSGGTKINIDKSINEAIAKGGSKLRADYSYKVKKGDTYYLENIYSEVSEMFKKMYVKIENTNIAYKHNSDLKYKGLVEQKKKQKENSMRSQIIEELRAKGLLKEDIIDDEIEKLDNI